MYEYRYDNATRHMTDPQVTIESLLAMQELCDANALAVRENLRTTFPVYIGIPQYELVLPW